VQPACNSTRPDAQDLGLPAEDPCKPARHAPGGGNAGAGPGNGHAPCTGTRWRGTKTNKPPRTRILTKTQHDSDVEMLSEQQSDHPARGHNEVVVEPSSTDSSPEARTQPLPQDAAALDVLVPVAPSVANARTSQRRPKGSQSRNMVIPTTQGSTIPPQEFPLTNRKAEKLRQARLDKSALLRQLENDQMQEQLHLIPLPAAPAPDPAPRIPTPHPLLADLAPLIVFPPLHARPVSPVMSQTLHVTTLDALPPSPDISISALASDGEIDEDQVDENHHEDDVDKFNEYNNAISEGEGMDMDEIIDEDVPEAPSTEYQLPTPPPANRRFEGHTSPLPAPRASIAAAAKQGRNKPSRGTGLPTPTGHPPAATATAGTTQTQPATPRRHTTADKGKAPAYAKPANAFARIQQNAIALRERAGHVLITDCLATSEAHNVRRTKANMGPVPENKKPNGFMCEPAGGWEQIGRSSPLWWSRHLVTEDRLAWEDAGENNNGLIITPFNAVTNISDDEVISGPIRVVQIALSELIASKLKIRYARVPPGKDSRRSESLLLHNITNDEKAKVLRSPIYCHSRVAFAVQPAQYLVPDFIAIINTVLDNGLNPEETALAMLDMVKHHLHAEGMVDLTLAAVCEGINLSLTKEDLENKVWDQHKQFLDSLSVKPILIVRHEEPHYKQL
jgi:hypothetical protein